MISLLAQATATLRIVGLASVMHINPGNPGIDVVMPRVQSVSSRNAVMLHPIGNHVPILVFPTKALAETPSGWEPKPFDDEFSYISLDGEHVQFTLNADNPTATVPPQLPKLTNGCRWSGIQSGRIQQVAKTKRTKGGQPLNAAPPPLTEGYLPPAYPDAAAVLNIPYGETSACYAHVKDKTLTRIDTNVVWRTNGRVTVIGKKEGNVKELTLDSERLEGQHLLIVAGNVPAYLVENKGTTYYMDAGHYAAYYNMLVADGRGNCVRGGGTGEEIKSCEEPSFIRIGSSHVRVVSPPPPQSFGIMTAECSNSQYP